MTISEEIKGTTVRLLLGAVVLAFLFFAVCTLEFWIKYFFLAVLAVMGMASAFIFGDMILVLIRRLKK